MAVIDIEAVPGLITGGRTLAALDLGDKTIGLAVADLGLSFAHPRPVLRRGKFSHDAAKLLTLFEAEAVAAVVMGLPINMDAARVRGHRRRAPSCATWAG